MNTYPWLTSILRNSLSTELQDSINKIKLIGTRFKTHEEISLNVCNYLLEKFNYLSYQLSSFTVGEISDFVFNVQTIIQAIQSFILRISRNQVSSTEIIYEFRRELLLLIRRMTRSYNLFIDVELLTNLINEVPQNLSFSSPTKAWYRGLCKYNPSTCVNLSPIKMAIDNFEPSQLTDNMCKGLHWILVMSEKLYYDNACLLCSQYNRNKDELKKYLRLTTEPMTLRYMTQHWYNIKIVGQGSFGKVAQVRDSSNGSIFAVKYILPKADRQKEMIQFIRERNYLIRCSNSPLSVKILRAFQLPTLTGFFMCMEYCCSNLKDFLTNLYRKSEDLDVFRSFNFHEPPEVYTNKYETLSTNLGFSLRYVIVIYIFELFAILDYLADCHIVHCDIKPANILIADNFHLKIADLGLVNNYFHISKSTQIKFRKWNEIDASLTDYVNEARKGNRLYADIERCYQYLLQHNPDLLQLFLDNDGTYDLQNSSKDYNFLYDIWAMGIISLEIMFLGFNIFDRRQMGQYRHLLYKQNDDSSEYHILYMVLSHQYFGSFKNKLTQLFGHYLGTLPTFIGKIINPRGRRCTQYLKQKTLLVYDRLQSFSSIDLGKVQDINIFKHYNLHSSNIFMHELPSEIQELLQRTDGGVDTSTIGFTDYYSELRNMPERNFEGCRPLQPGMDIIIN